MTWEIRGRMPATGVNRGNLQLTRAIRGNEPVTWIFQSHQSGMRDLATMFTLLVAAPLMLAMTVVALLMSPLVMKAMLLMTSTLTMAVMLTLPRPRTRQGRSFLIIVPVELKRKWSQSSPSPITMAICFNLVMEGTNVHGGNVYPKQIPSFHQIVCSMTSGASLLASVIVAQIAKEVSVNVWTLIPHKMAIIFEFYVMSIYLLIIYTNGGIQGGRRGQMTTLPINSLLHICHAQ